MSPEKTSMISIGKMVDVDAIVQLTKDCGQHMRDNGIDQWDEHYPNIEVIMHDIQTETLFTYRKNDEVLGIIVLNDSQDEEYKEINWSTSDEDRNIVVHRLAVHPTQQGKGIGRMLMDFAEKWAKDHNYDAIRLDTYSQNPRNQKFYMNRGYKDLGSVFLKYKKTHPYYCYELVLNNKP
ncbi:MAG: GNAT family N-acetyltransferase [Deltaproteobacteria bacterium]|nr:GNAT family N-acetyltransferase [Deltaproteobacteria bacterium]